MEKFWCCVSFHRVAAQLYLPVTYILHMYVHTFKYIHILYRSCVLGPLVIVLFFGTALVFTKEEVGRTVFSFA